MAEYDLSNNEPLKIGFGQTDYFSGWMREVRLYNRALGDAEARAICEGTRAAISD
jgi:hypothetical protein